jgi:DNA-binding response OmpR family regulator
MGAAILVAEDDAKQADLVRRYLERDGHSCRVVSDGQAAIDAIRADPPDLLVLDLMMPVVDGLTVCRVVRGESELPILMLTARSTEDDLLLGLEHGADDYLTKPYSPRELAARVRTLLRRARWPVTARDGQVLRVGELTVDPLRRTVSVAGEPVETTPGEFGLLAVLAAQPGRVFTRAQLLAGSSTPVPPGRAAGPAHRQRPDRQLTDRTIDVHVMNLRKKLEADPRRPAYLLTVYGIGYKLGDGHRASADDRSVDAHTGR